MKELKKSYNSAIIMFILSILIIAIQTSLFFITNTIVKTTINLLTYILLTFIIALYFSLMNGFIFLGSKQHLKTKNITIGLLVNILILLLLGLLLYLFTTDKIITTTISLLIIIFIISYSILKILFGIDTRKIQTENNTKTYLSITSLLEGISLISIIGILLFPLLNFRSTFYSTLLLKDILNKNTENKNTRNLLWSIIPTTLYLILISILTYTFFPFWTLL